MKRPYKTVFKGLGLQFRFSGFEFIREPVGTTHEDPRNQGEAAASTSQTALTTVTDNEPSESTPRWLRWLGPCPKMKLYCIIMSLAVIVLFGLMLFKK